MIKSEFCNVENQYFSISDPDSGIMITKLEIYSKALKKEVYTFNLVYRALAALAEQDISVIFNIGNVSK